MNGPRSVDPTAAYELLDEGSAMLIDIREPDEQARRSIPGAQSLPLSNFAAAKPIRTDRLVIFHCRTGSRTRAKFS